ncbi:MAG: cyclodeaminase [Acidimicrobiia bacterium]
MGEIRILTETDLRKAVSLGETELEAIEAVFPIISEGRGSMPPIMRIEVPERNGEIDVKSAYLPGYPGIAVKLSAGFFDNPGLGLPSLGGLMVVLDAETGLPRCALFDNGYLTDLRTGLAGAVAANHLADPDATVAAVFGAGVQARIQLQSLQLVRGLEKAFIWSRRAEQASSLAARLTESLGIPVEATEDPLRAAAAAQILVTTTPATTPIVTGEMLHEGLHITAIGSDAETKQELQVDVIDRADLFVCDSVAQSRRLGELRAAVASGFDPARAVELGRIISGQKTGRTDSAAITVCDLTGTGAQDTAIASLSMERCQATGAGMVIET